MLHSILDESSNEGIMLARVYILLPFAFTIPKNATFNIYQFETDDGYIVRIYPPVRSDKVDRHHDAETIWLNDVEAVDVDVLRIDFQKEKFDRREARHDTDPPEKLVHGIANDFLERARHVTNGSQIKTLSTPLQYRVDYLNDDETAPASEKGLIKGKGTIGFKVSWIGLNNEIWEDIFDTYDGVELPAWKGLLLDAYALLPAVGPSVVLAHTAIEVFVSTLLTKMVSIGKMDKELWEWLNTRGGNKLKEPSVEERLDFLSDYLVGASLKEQSGLWENFKKLRKARNSFAHEGVAKIGSDLVTEDVARQLVGRAKEITDFFRGKLPEEQRWPEYRHVMKVQAKVRVREKEQTSTDSNKDDEMAEDLGSNG